MNIVKPDGEFFPLVKGSLYNVHRQMANEARRKNMWLFHKVSREWYTPDEFVKMWDNTGYNVTEDSLSIYKMEDPRKGLKARKDFIVKVSNEAMTFAMKVADYYSDLNQG